MAAFSAELWITYVLCMLMGIDELLCESLIDFQMAEEFLGVTMVGFNQIKFIGLPSYLD